MTPQTASPAPRATTKVCSVVTALEKNAINFPPVFNMDMKKAAIGRQLSSEKSEQSYSFVISINPFIIFYDARKNGL